MLSPLQLQSIVDGECTPVQRRELLAHCDDRPEQWKTLALALLEDQEFRIRLNKMARQQRASESTGAADATPNLTAILPTQPPRGAYASRFNWGPLLAAGLLIGIGFWSGMKLGTFDTNTAPENGLVSNENQKMGLDSLGMQPTGVPQNSRNMLVNDNGRYRSDLPEADLRVQVPGGRGVEEIPIYDAAEVDPMLVMAQQAYEVQKANQKLRRSGFEIDMRPNFVTGQLPDGRQVVVPMHQVGLKPYGQ